MLLELIAQRQELADQVVAVVWVEEEEEVTLDYHLPFFITINYSHVAPLQSTLSDVPSYPPCHIPHLMHEIPT